MEIIGRGAELRTIHQALISGKPELVAVWGRRRVGKTYLVRHGRAPVADRYFELTGQRDRSTSCSTCAAAPSICSSSNSAIGRLS